MARVKNISSAEVIQAPTGGLNVLDSLAGMAPTDAVILDNWVPTPWGCTMRQGYRQHQTAADNVETLMVWYGTQPDIEEGGKQVLLAAAGGEIWDVTIAGAAPISLAAAGTVGSDINRWQWTNFGNVSGTYLYAVNGESEPFVLGVDGSTVTRLAAGSGTVPWTIAGVDPKKFVHTTEHMKRLWFVEVESTNAWYLDAAYLWGQAYRFNFGTVFRKGGYLVALASWTVDAGAGVDDHLVAISSSGEVALYTGTNPSSIASWNLVGVYYIGEPVGRRCTVQLDGDVGVLTQQGLVPLAQALSSTQVNWGSTAWTNKIQNAISQSITADSNLFGWQLLVNPTANQLVLNVPNSNGEYYQYVMHTITKSWCKFTGMQAHCMVLLKKNVVFAFGPSIYVMNTGTTDNAATDGTGGNSIRATAQQAYNFFKSPPLQKHFKMIRPGCLVSSPISYRVGLNIDFNQTNVYSSTVAPPNTMALWDIALWDTDVWASSSQTADRRWQDTLGIGTAASVLFEVTTSNGCTWIGTDLVYEVGGLL